VLSKTPTLPHQLAAIAAGLTVNVLQTVALMGMMTVPQLECGWESCFEGNLQENGRPAILLEML